MDVQLFKNCMSKIPTSVSLVSVVDQGFLSACTISSLMSVSVDSSVILFVLKSQSKTLVSINQSQYFSINLLSRSQADLSIEYSGKREDQKIENLQDPWEISQEKFPILRNSALTLACGIIDSKIIGSSTLVTATILSQLTSEENDPLVYLNRSYHSISPIK